MLTVFFLFEEKKIIQVLLGAEWKSKATLRRVALKSWL